MSEATFAEEYPHLTKLGRWLGRYLVGFAAALAAAAALAHFGVRPFPSGFIAALVYMHASGQVRA